MTAHENTDPQELDPDASTRRVGDGDIEYRDSENRLHRSDGPALERPDGHKEWWQHGKLHRDKGPAIERWDGSKEWWQHGKRHREDGPAVEQADGTQLWYQHDELHRDDGPAVEYADGSTEWRQHGERHRVGGPAVERADGERQWWNHGERHRVGGPAVERADGERQWWNHGERHRVGGPAVERASASAAAVEAARLDATLRLSYAAERHPDLRKAEARARLDLAAAIIAMDQADLPNERSAASLSARIAVEQALRAYGNALAGLIREEDDS